MKLSIVATLYHSASYIAEFHKRASAVAKAFSGDDYEIVFVNDGSPDNSLELAICVAEQDSHVVVVDLSKNFGHHKAMMTGLSHATGDYIFLIDSDLEEDPEWFDAFFEKMEQTESDVVYGVQVARKGRWFERWSGRLYYRLMCALMGINLPESVVTARLMTKRFVDVLMLHDEREMFLGGLFSLAGFEQVPIPVKKHSTSETTYTFTRKMILLVNTVTSFSNVPLMMIFYLGVMISGTACAFLAYILLNWVLRDAPPSGWTSVIASIWLMGGLMISFLGVIGIYLSKMFIETKRRPYTIVRKKYGGKQ